MQDGMSASAGSRITKRRRLDGSASEDVSQSSGTYEQWNNAHPNQGTQPFAATQAGVTYGNPAVAASSALSASDSWRPSEVATSYPELGSYQQHPYFYAPSGQATYNQNWSASTTQAYPDAPVAATYSVRAPSTTATMPFFPPQAAGAANGEKADANEATDGISYVDSEQALQLAEYSAPSATATLAQREAAKSSAYYFDDASMHLKIQSLPILDNLATQLIHTISKASFLQIQDLMRGADSEDSQAYKTLKSLFDQTRKVYSRETPFIDAIAIQMFQPNQQEIIRKANIATFISSILGAHDVSFFHLNEFFMETFVPLGHRLLKWQGAIYLEMKTQIYISALINSDGRPEEMLDELFPPDLDAQILTRHPDAPSLSPSEQDFIDRSRSRKSYLLAEPSNNESLKQLPKKYQWSDFVREFASCITKNVEGIMNVPVRSQAGGGAGSKALDQLASTNGTNNTSTSTGSAANKAGRDTSAAESKKNSAALSVVRQPWTKPEEDALLNGLERVNGPHWSQILALYGRGGSMSEILKDRNQVQLKDKARNLKLWYLKTGKEVPPALKGVTGELRKRGGARAKAALGLTGDDEEQEDGTEDGPDAVAVGDGAVGKGAKRKKSSKK